MGVSPFYQTGHPCCERLLGNPNLMRQCQPYAEAAAEGVWGLHVPPWASMRGAAEGHGSSRSTYPTPRTVCSRRGSPPASVLRRR